MSPLISILIATKGRRDELERCWTVWRQLDSRESIGHEVIVANQCCRRVDRECGRRVGKAARGIRAGALGSRAEPIPGKSRALNKLFIWLEEKFSDF